MCLGRWKRRGRGAGWQVVWATAARGARSQLPGPQGEADWLDWQTKGDLPWHRRLG